MPTRNQALVGSALAICMSLAAVQVQAQTSGATRQETQRGVPGVNVDVNTNANGRPRSNGMPGVDVDVNTTAGRNANTGRNARRGEVDTRASGAGAATTGTSQNSAGDTNQRAARADRN